MAQKKVKMGTLLATEVTDKRTNQKKKLLSIGLGNKGNNDKYNTSVTITVRDSNGNVIAEQTDGFLELTDPRKEADELLAADLIDENMHAKMKEGVAKLSEKVRYVVKMKAS